MSTMSYVATIANTGAAASKRAIAVVTGGARTAMRLALANPLASAAVGAVLLALLLLLFLRTRTTSTSTIQRKTSGSGVNTQKREGFATAATTGTPATMRFLMYYSDQCPHCVAAKPEFAKLGASQVTPSGVTVAIQSVDMQTPAGTATAAATGGPVAGYPTFRLVAPDGTLVSEYSGDRTEAAFKAFLADATSGSATTGAAPTA